MSPFTEEFQANFLILIPYAFISTTYFLGAEKEGRNHRFVLFLVFTAAAAWLLSSFSLNSVQRWFRC